MRKNEFLKGQYDFIEKAVRVSLKKAQKKEGGKHRDTDSLSTLLTLSYMGFLVKAFNDNSINKIDENERKIDEMVDLILNNGIAD
ncbi:MAG TPA: hypothetical protein GX519_06665 [Thermoanaerobacterales bacterium]|nr:hypothetical protein [Thermoanaerobacterales bacterium]